MHHARSVVSAVAAAATVATIIVAAPPAAAATIHVSNDCNIADKDIHCFRIHYASRDETTQQSRSACFVTRRSRTSEYGYDTPPFYNKFNFSDFPSELYKGGMKHPCGGNGAPEAVWDNAASGWNQDPYAAYSVYTEVGYDGAHKTFPKADGIARNFGSGLKNKNASHKRFT